MKIAEHWKYRLGTLILFIGLMMVLHCVGALLDYHESASKYIKQVDPLMDHLLDWSSNLGTDRDVAAVKKDIQSARHFDRPTSAASSIPKYPAAQYHIGFILLMFGVWYAEKHKHKKRNPIPPIEATEPWESVPAPKLKRNPAIDYHH